MRRRLIGGFLLFVVVFLVVLEVPFGLSLAANARTTSLSELKSDAASLGLFVGSALDSADPSGAHALMERFASAEGAIVVVVSHGRTELAAGLGAAEELGDPATRGIVASAASGQISGEEGSNDPDDDLLYVALPLSVRTGGAGSVAHVADVMLVAEPAAPLHDRINGDWGKLAAFGAVMLVVASAAGMFLAGTLTRPLGRIESAVAALGAGKLNERAPVGHGPAELKALGDTVNEMADRLEELLGAQRAFVADASHQLRTPMTALRLRLENLEGVLGTDGPADLGPALNEVDRLSRVVDGLLSLARAEGTRPGRVRINVGSVLADRLDAWSALAEERHVTLVGAGEGEVGWARHELAATACPGYLEQVLDNLLSNALDATPAEGSVLLAADRVPDAVLIHVIDTGPGMNAADRQRAFDRFWRPEGAQQAGTGLGLAIVAQLVRACGGSVWLDSAPGGGVDAVVRLDAAGRASTPTSSPVSGA